MTMATHILTCAIFLLLSLCNGVMAKEEGFICGTVCALDWKPLCGSDGKLYSNECQMNSAACKAGSTITVAKRCSGVDCKCDGMASQERVDCSEVKVCPLDWKPLCGSDGKMYSNECQMNSAACKAGSSITVAKRCSGVCECDGVVSH